MLVLAGWPDHEPPEGGWRGADLTGRALLLAHMASHGQPSPPVGTTEDQSVRAVLAGRLYNRRELTVALGGRHSLSGRDDAEIVAHLYEERGLKCVKALRGAFALALWDAQRGRLLLARDHLGLVPLYFAADGHRLAASSALRALTALPGVAQAWDAAALDTFLTFGFIPPPGTLHPAIRQLAPAELAVWEGGRLRLQRYWHLSFPERRLAAADAAVLVRDQARDAIRLRLAGVVGGLLLSDGLDAAAILSLVAADERPPAAAYTATFAGEGRGAARLAARLGVKHVPVDTAPDWPALLDGLLAAEGGPGASLDDAVLAVAIARAAADLGVALAGVGGEEIFGSSAPARAAARVRYYGSLPAVARELVVVTGRVAPALLSSAVHATIGAARLAPLELYARTVSLVLPEERATLYTPEALALMGDATPWRSLAALFADAAAAGATDTRDAIHYVEVAFRLPARASVIVAAAAAGLELRLPFADHRLAQIAASTPPASRSGVRDRQSLLGAAMADLLPRTLRAAAHRAPAPPPEAWRAGSLRALAEDLLAPARVRAQGIFLPDHVQRLWQEHLAGERDHGRCLWRLLVASRWLEGRAAPAVWATRAAG